MTHPIQTYLDHIRQNLDAGIATEHTHRSALQALLESLTGGADAAAVRVINEPRRIACGAPDLAVLKDRWLVGHVEAKDVGASLDAAEHSEQLKRYLAALDNLVLTDYLEFRWYIGGERRAVARLAARDAHGKLKSSRADQEAVTALLGDFLAHAPQPVAAPRELAERMARLTHLVREIIVAAFETGQASALLRGWREAFARVLIADLDQPDKLGDFADMVAQTLAYGLFSARVMCAGVGFDRQAAQQFIPRTNPFLRDFFYQITGPQLDDEPFAGFVEDLVQLLARADMEAILADFGKRTRQDDPTVHFYETFLAAYDPRLRELRGVYYTPTPVVSFIVRSVDALLKSRFGLPDGLADTAKITVKNHDPGLRVKGKQSQARKTTEVHRVLILDPAAGTATFPYAVIDLIRAQFMARGDAGLWSGYVRAHLLPRIFGFELLMAPYAVAHFKLALQLAGHDLDPALRPAWAYDFQGDERVQVYLTNALEGPHEFTGLPLFTQFLAAETQAANAVKQDLPIMVVLGNPPYSGHSANRGAWIGDLLRGRLPDGGQSASYYEVDGQPLGERNPKWLQDDYVKFIRFGQWRIEQSGGGVLAFVNNHGYLDNPTFRGMRQSLLDAFSEIYLLDLHGNARKKETAPDGGPDENVFDIMQGVAIGLFVKRPGQAGPAKVYHADLWGKRADKHRRLWETDAMTLEWEELKPQTPFYLFVPRDIDLLAEYEQGIRISEAIPLNSMGVTTGRNDFAVSFCLDELQARLDDLSSSRSDDEIRTQYKLTDSSSFDLRSARSWAKESTDSSVIQQFSYRCFDHRYVIYSPYILARGREDVCKHQIGKENLALTTFRAIRELPWFHVFVAKHIVAKEYISSLDNCYVFPLYLYPEKSAASLFDPAAFSPWPPDPARGGRTPNLSPEFVKAAEETLGLPFTPVQRHSERSEESFGPEDLLAYVYAILHSPTYRARYAGFLKIDFPRLPLTSDAALFWRLVELGRELIALHLLDLAGLGPTVPGRQPARSAPAPAYPVPGDNAVAARGGYPRYAAGRVYINPTQYFEGVPEEVWEFQVGGYQVCEKWLKDRRGRLLTYDELTHYRRVVVALRETLRLMAEIDAAIPAWPLP